MRDARLITRVDRLAKSDVTVVLEPLKFIKIIDRYEHRCRLPVLREHNTFMAAPGGRTIDRPELAREIASIEAMKEPAEVFRQCPKCGAEHFTQRAWRGQ